MYASNKSIGKNSEKGTPKTCIFMHVFGVFSTIKLLLANIKNDKLKKKIYN
jgi:hypothetical protein